MSVISFKLLKERIQDIHPRTKKAHFNTLVGICVKGGGMLISLLLVPLTIDYLNKGVYGTWLTISSIVTMIAFFDIGIGNGLRNKLSEAISKKDFTLAKTYVSTAYAMFGGLQSIFILSFFFIKNVPWQKILNTNIDVNVLQTVILITACCLSIKLVLDILTYILLAIQESGIVGIINLITNIITLLFIFLLSRFTTNQLAYLALITSMSPIVVLLISSNILYRGKLNNYRPKINYIDFRYGKDILTLGYKFFLIQLSVIILFYSDNIIVTQLFGSSEVTTYNIAYKYFNAANTLFFIIITPYWSAFTEAYANKDLGWIKRTYNYMVKLWIALTLIIVIMITLSSYMYDIWIGDRVQIPFILNVVMGSNVVLICWNNLNVSVINGLGKIRLQLYCSLFSSIVNIPLAIFIGKILNVGSAGVVVATCLSLLPSTILGTIQARKLINGHDNGIWGR